MSCHTIQRRLLSPFLDERLGEEARVEVARHLGRCSACRAELERLTLLRRRLRVLGPIEAPPYLRRLVDRRLADARPGRWLAALRSSWEYRWSRIRTTEALWFGARLAGTAASGLLFFALYTAMSPLTVPFSDEPGSFASLRQQLPQTVLRNLGLITLESQRRPISPSDPGINGLYLLNFGQSVSRSGADDSFSVVAAVDRSGTATIQNVLEYPSDTRLLSSFNAMLVSARCRPARHNGRDVDAHLVLSFSVISVSD